jgi:hypothetical protein
MQAIIYSSDDSTACYNLNTLAASPAYSLIVLTSAYTSGSSGWFVNMAIPNSADLPNIIDLVEASISGNSWCIKSKYTSLVST